MTFRDKLKLLRIQWKLTQQQLADKSGVPVATIRCLERGARRPNWKTLLQISNALNVSLGNFDGCTVGEEFKAELKMKNS